MGTPIKLGIIGAGSAQFSLGLVRDLCLTENMAGSTVCLMDVDEGRVDMVRNLAMRYADELGFDLTFERALTREPALRDADFVINTASAGAHGEGGFNSVHNLMSNIECSMFNIQPMACPLDIER